MGKLKFKGSTGEGFTLPPEGTFDIQVTAVKEAASKDGDLQLQVDCEIADGPHAGKKFKQWFTLNEEKAWLFEKLLDATGVDYEKMEGAEGEPPDMEVDTDELLFTYFKATIKLNKSGDKTYVNLNDWQASELSDEGGGGETAKEEPQPAVAPEVAAAAAAPTNASTPRARRPRPNTTNA